MVDHHLLSPVLFQNFFVLSSTKRPLRPKCVNSFTPFKVKVPWTSKTSQTSHDNCGFTYPVLRKNTVTKAAIQTHLQMFIILSSMTHLHFLKNGNICLSFRQFLVYTWHHRPPARNLTPGRPVCWFQGKIIVSRQALSSWCYLIKPQSRFLCHSPHREDQCSFTQWHYFPLLFLSDHHPLQAFLRHNFSFFLFFSLLVP